MLLKLARNFLTNRFLIIMPPMLSPWKEEKAPCNWHSKTSPLMSSSLLLVSYHQTCVCVCVCMFARVCCATRGGCCSRTEHSLLIPSSLQGLMILRLIMACHRLKVPVHFSLVLHLLINSPLRRTFCFSLQFTQGLQALIMNHFIW